MLFYYLQWYAVDKENFDRERNLRASIYLLEKDFKVIINQEKTP